MNELEKLVFSKLGFEGEESEAKEIVQAVMEKVMEQMPKKRKNEEDDYDYAWNTCIGRMETIFKSLLK